MNAPTAATQIPMRPLADAETRIRFTPGSQPSTAPAVAVAPAKPPKSSALCTLLAGVPTLLWGAPGIGKTSWLNAQFRANQTKAFTLIGSIIDPTDVGGLLTRDTDCAFYLLPEWFRELQGGGVLILDELSCAPPSVQAGMLRVVAERRIHARRLPDNVLIAACANPQDQAASGYELAPPMANRFAHYDYPIDLNEWSRGFLGGWADPEPCALPVGWETYLADARGLIAGFLRKRPELLNQMPSEEAQQGKAWPSGRTWELLARSIAAHKACKLEIGEAAIALVGPGAGQEFGTWAREVDLPDPELVLGQPDVIKRQWADHKIYAVLGAVLGAWSRKATEERFQQACEVMAYVAGEAPIRPGGIGKGDLAFPIASKLLKEGIDKKFKLPPIFNDVFLPLAVGALDGKVIRADEKKKKAAKPDGGAAS